MNPLKVGFYILARDKAQHIRKSVESALGQTYSPFTIYLSDQGSTDGTAEILDEYATQYIGPNRIVRINCPDRTPYSMTALIRHFNWAINATPDVDLMLIQSADDYCAPTRVERTVATYLEHKPSYIGTLVQFENPDGEDIAWTLHQREGFATGAEILDQRIGGSTTCAFDREFWNKIGGCSELMLPDVALPFMAAQERGYYMINEPLGVYVRHQGPQNTGLEGQMAALQSDPERIQMNELMACEVSSGLAGLLQPFHEGKLKFKEQSEEMALFHHCIGSWITWSVSRRQLHAAGLSPIGRAA